MSDDLAVTRQRTGYVDAPVARQPVGGQSRRLSMVEAVLSFCRSIRNALSRRLK